MTVHVAGRAIPTDPRVAWQSVRAEAMSYSRGLWAWLAILGILLLVGAIGALRSLFPGDKGIGTTPSFEWGLLIVGYVFFAITTSGLCLASSLGTVFGIDRFRPLEKRHAILAVLSLVTAFGIIALDLHWPVRLVFGAVLNPSPTSPMWWMGVCYGFYLCVLLTEVWSMFTDHPVIHQYACTAAMCTAIVAPTTLGAVFGVLANRPFWAGPFTPILMVATAFIAGTSLLGVVFYVVHRLRLAGSERAASVALPSIRLLLAVGLVLVSALIVREIVVGLMGGQPGLAEATQALVAGPLAWQFWGIRVVAGLGVPMVLLALPRTRTPEGTLVASLLIWVGVFADRLTFVSAGQIAPTTTTSGVVSTPYAAYTPSPVEIAIILGALGFMGFAYTMAERYLDLREADVHFGFPFARLLPARFRGSNGTVHGAQAPGLPAALAVLQAPDAVPGGIGTSEVPRSAALTSQPEPVSTTADVGPGEANAETEAADAAPSLLSPDVSAVRAADAADATEGLETPAAGSVEVAQGLHAAASTDLEPAPAAASPEDEIAGALEPPVPATAGSLSEPDESGLQAPEPGLEPEGLAGPDPSLEPAGLGAAQQSPSAEMAR